MIDFERDFGVNAGYAQALYEDWQSDPESVEASWRTLFERLDGIASARERARGGDGAARAATPRRVPSEGATPRAEATPAPAARRAAPAPPEDEEADFEPLKGLAGRIAENMEASLRLPTATSVRTVPAKLLDENRRILNEHMRIRALGKASYTHLIAFALARAVGEMPRVQSALVEGEGGERWRRVPRQVNLGLAIDVPAREGRMLVVPSIKRAEGLGFREFHAAYEDLVARGREGKLTREDFQGTTCTLTNPGGFGTSMSVPRLMEGQGLIIATGSIGVPPELAGVSGGALAQLAIGPVMTVTSTYDHRVVQGAESGLFLQRVDALLQGADGFYEEIFRALRVPWRPHVAATDAGPRRDLDAAEAQAKVWALINAYRVRGSRLADLDPLEYRPDPLPSLDPAAYGFTVWDLDRSFLCGGMAGRQTMTLREVLATLRRAYCRRWTLEYMHIVERRRKHWIRDRVEDPAQESAIDAEHRRWILGMLFRAENFERFLHARYVGNKRFSLEGADSMIPALAELIERAAERGVRRVVVGMAHRGRLNVLVHILRKSYAQVFGEFEGVLLPLSSEGSGDVKYHLGQRGTYRTRGGIEVEVLLSANPSHLEAVDPVVCGLARAWQDREGDLERKHTLAVLIHGDAAFSGQGVVAETMNMSELPAYRCGGTVHLVIDNQIGFTAGPRDLKSTYYCTDIAKSVQAPILHANGDFPESVLRAVHLAVDYQREFGGDAVIDMVCYRRWGHNEGDEPAFTQPLLYARIREHPTPRESYTQLLIRRGVLDAEQAAEIGARFDAELQSAVETFRAEAPRELERHEVIDLDHDEPGDYSDEPAPDTGVPAERLVELIDRANAMPDGLVVHSNLLRQLRRREQMVRGGRDLDWGCAETLAFAALLEDGVSIRLAGQDSQRGTFSHRHAVIHDQQGEREHVPLASLPAVQEGRARFEAWNSLLSEEAALAFEYGYSLATERSLVLWEAQFGDFVNGAQIPIDQFLVSGWAKWKQESGLVLLLPHGYDGQGPEHSSARPERFLAACSGGNLTVANCTSAAQYFHLLRRHGLHGRRRPLIVLTPKSLLRDPRAASPIEDLATGRFLELIPDSVVDPAAVRRVVLCTGKLYHELASRRAEEERKDVALLRLEQLYPLPRRALEEELARYGEVELLWCQEEPRNMGFWPYVMQRFADLDRPIRYVGRPDSASPATGSYRRHVIEQDYVLERALD